MEHYLCSAVTEYVTAEQWSVPLSVLNFPSVCSAKSQSDYTALDFTLRLRSDPGCKFCDCLSKLPTLQPSSTVSVGVVRKTMLCENPIVCVCKHNMLSGRDYNNQVFQSVSRLHATTCICVKRKKQYPLVCVPSCKTMIQDVSTPANIQSYCIMLTCNSMSHMS